MSQGRGVKAQKAKRPQVQSLVQRGGQEGKSTVFMINNIYIKNDKAL